MHPQALPRSLARWWWGSAAAAAVLALALGPPGFWAYLQNRGHPPSAPDVVYRTLQLFVLGGDSLDGAVPWALQASRFLAAYVAFAAVAAALLQLFRGPVQGLRLRLFHDHYVVCGLGPVAARLVDALLRLGARVVVVEPDGGRDDARRCAEAGAVVLAGAGAGAGLLRRAGLGRARALLALAADDAANLRAALLARQEAGAAGRDLKCVVQVSSREMRELLVRQDVLGGAADPFRIEVFNVHEAGARVILRENPALYAGREPEHVLLVGLGGLGEALLLRTARDWLIDGPRPGRRPRVTVVDREARRLGERLCQTYPLLRQACAVEFRDLDVLSPQFDAGTFLPADDPGSPVDVAFVCLPDESLSLLAGTRLARLLAAHAAPVVVRVTAEDGLGKLVGAGGRLRTVSLSELLARPDVVLDASREALAQEIHAQYVRAERAEGRDVASNANLVPWHELSEEARESNRRQADHIPVKLRAAGCRLAPAGDGLPDFAFTDAEVERLARMEHERWETELRDAGWRLGPVKDRAARTHAALRPWEDLGEDDRERNRRAVRLVPSLVARLGYAIVREGPPG